jgi:hypothetical protein
MKKILLIFFVAALHFTVFAQKAEIRIIKNGDSALSAWQILDEKYLPVVTGDEFPSGDTIILSLEANKRYFFEVSVSEIFHLDTSLYSLMINDESIMLVSSVIGPGDHFLPFFTGTRPEPEAKITGGTDVDISEFPWQIYLESRNYLCGGSIIDNEWILTAAHCAVDDNNVVIRASEMEVKAGANNPRNPSDGRLYYVSQVIVHEDFDPVTLNNDIALLKLREPISYVNAEPIKLISEIDALDGATDPGVMTWVTGYGITSIDPPAYPTTLQMIRLPIVTNEQASTVWKNIPGTDMMAGYRTTNKDACTGDSGGPLVVAVSGSYKLAGLVSWGSSKCDTYGAYTRLSLFESWITSKTGIEITFRAPVPQGDSIICPGTLLSEYNVSPVNGASGYEWSLVPDYAGSMTGINQTATVVWNRDFTGRASVNLKVLRNEEVSEMSQLTVNVAKATRLISEPEDTVFCAEQPFTLKTEAEGYNLVYTWYKNSSLFNSGSSGSVTIPDATTHDSGEYYCEITGSCGDAMTTPASLTVLPVTRISQISPDKEVPFGDDITLESVNEGHNLSYQWYKDDNILNSGTLSYFELKNVNANDIGLYRVMVSGSCGTETSDNVYVYVKNESSSTDPKIYVWPTIINNEFRIALNSDQYYGILLFNMTGKLLKDIINCQYQTTIDMGGLPSGIYIVTVYTQYFRKSVKIIKK